MNLKVRLLTDKVFTCSSSASIVLLIVTLVIILAPMLYRGGKAVFFNGTVEFKRLQFEEHGRGNEDSLKKEFAEYERQKADIYQFLNDFSEGIDTSNSIDHLKDIYREYGRQLRYENVDNDTYRELRSRAKDVRNLLIDAMESDDKSEAMELVQSALDSRDKVFEGSVFAETFAIANKYQSVLKDTDLSKRDIYTNELVEVKELVAKLFGPDPAKDKPMLIMQQYGATRLDYARDLIKKITIKETWEQQPGKKALIRTQTLRSDIFESTPLESFFRTLPEKAENILKPKFTVYWQYFIDDSTPGHFFGGVGPEIIGTLSLTLMAMLFAVPLGIISAAYLAECASDNIIIKIIRMSINTLAGVPSIVFGLFGMAFFVLFLMPAIGHESKPSMLTASMTLAILVLPVIIRASEEAIKSVPKTYKEASLALGAGGFKTFVSVTLPAAMPGILTGVILSLSRAAGETAPILFTGAVALGPIPKSIFDSTRALSYGCYDMAVGDRIAALVPHKQYGMVATLILLVLCLNFVAICIRSKMSSRLRGS
ncbi:MAG: phosphate ABC transporter permease PstA [Sedimentisphaeraceae bacterium JB056]